MPFPNLMWHHLLRPLLCIVSVSYTHLDVYKRQIQWTGSVIRNRLLIAKIKTIEVNTRSSLVQKLMGGLEVEVDIFAEAALPVKGLRILFSGTSGLDVHAKGIFHAVNPLDQFLDSQPE